MNYTPRAAHVFAEQGWMEWFGNHGGRSFGLHSFLGGFTHPLYLGFGLLLVLGGIRGVDGEVCLFRLFRFKRLFHFRVARVL